MIKIGGLVKWVWSRNSSWFAIVLDDQEEEDEYGTVGILVLWVTGKYIGGEEFIPAEELEVIA